MEFFHELPSTAKPIERAEDYWVDVDGSVYSLTNRTVREQEYFRKAQKTCLGYKYVGIKYIGDDHLTSKRVHRLVAEAFLENPNNYPCVGHKNNIKSDNRVENLYWTTISENTKKAFDDGLEINTKGIEDSQSLPCMMYETSSNKLLNAFGSAREAERETGICMSTVLRQCRYKRPARKPFYFRFCTKDEYLSYKCESTIESEKQVE